MWAFTQLQINGIVLYSHTVFSVITIVCSSTPTRFPNHDCISAFWSTIPSCLSKTQRETFKAQRELSAQLLPKAKTFGSWMPDCFVPFEISSRGHTPVQRNM